MHKLLQARTTCTTQSTALVFQVGRLLSTQASVQHNFVKDRRKWKQEISALRKKFAEEYQSAKREKEEKLRAEQAIKTAEKKARRILKKERVRKNLEKEESKRQESARLHNIHLEKQAKVREVEKRRWDEINLNLKEQLQQESSTWFNASNVDELLNEEFFDKGPSSTGYHSRMSYYMKYYHYADWDKEHWGQYKEDMVADGENVLDLDEFYAGNQDISLDESDFEGGDDGQDVEDPPAGLSGAEGAEGEGEELADEADHQKLKQDLLDTYEKVKAANEEDACLIGQNAKYWMEGEDIVDTLAKTPEEVRDREAIIDFITEMRVMKDELAAKEVTEDQKGSSEFEKMYDEIDEEH